MTISDMIRNALLAGLGLQEAVKEFLDDLIKRGELSESQGAKIFKEWSEKAGKTSDLLTQNVSELLNNSLKKMSLPTKDDIERLNKEVRSLSRRIGKIEDAMEETGKGE